MFNFNFFTSLGFFLFSFFLDNEFLFCGLFWIMFHLEKGLCSIVHDYIYLNVLSLLFLLLLRISSLELIRSFFDFLF
uniref:succinate dehydrogenase subunit 4 n=1 Tax=Campylaephora kondoi TaxID=218449 RepID=UPI002E77A251|nr:succinate dehydrogenase subunit 4 [Campylaephora kondoi]WQF69474.1 succinate dehydrogenase subunit 4 [Campylaephora kondoi]